jgi:hypothetical protein
MSDLAAGMMNIEQSCIRYKEERERRWQCNASAAQDWRTPGSARITTQ